VLTVLSVSVIAPLVGAANCNVTVTEAPSARPLGDTDT
jgi:hypothetical protein